MIIPLGKKPFEMNMNYFILFGWFYKSDFFIHHISQKASVSQVKIIRYFLKVVAVVHNLSPCNLHYI